MQYDLSVVTSVILNYCCIKTNPCVCQFISAVSSAQLGKPSLRVTPTTVCGWCYFLQLPIQVCFSSMLPELVFPDHSFTFSRKGNIFPLWP